MSLDVRMQPKQEQFLSSPADIVVGGGAAGGGKTYSLLIEPLRHVHRKDFNAVFLRRTYTEITKAGGIWDEAANLYPLLGATANSSGLLYRFPKQSKISFGHLQTNKDLDTWKSAQIDLLLFDQLETFEENQFFYMLSRNRARSGIRGYVRATANPEPNWLAEFLSWWIAEDGYADLDRAGKIRAFVRNPDNDSLVWADSKEELLTLYPDLDPKTVTFIPFTIYDNKILMKKDPGYLGSLKALQLLDRERLLGDPVRGGNWKIKAGAGKVFNGAWFNIVEPEAVPNTGIECRYFDTAATLKEVASADPDFTAGVKIRMVGNRIYVMDVFNRRVAPAQFYNAIYSVIRQDAEAAYQKGIRYMARWEEEPGSASKRESHTITSNLQGIDARAVRKHASKLTEWMPLAAQAEQGNVYVVNGSWNNVFITQMHGVPDLPHDDIADAASGAYNQIVKTTKAGKAGSSQG